MLVFLLAFRGGSPQPELLLYDPITADDLLITGTFYTVSYGCKLPALLISSVKLSIITLNLTSTRTLRTLLV